MQTALSRQCFLHFGYIETMGLTGFDSGLRWYVSMRSYDCELHNPVGQQFNWRKFLRSRCLIEVQEINFIPAQGAGTGHRSTDVVPNLVDQAVQANRK